MIEAKLKAGETYTFTETKAPARHKKADTFKYKVKDTGKTQKINVVDEYIGIDGGIFPNVKTGNNLLINVFAVLLLISAVCMVCISVVLFRKKKK